MNPTQTQALKTVTSLIGSRFNGSPLCSHLLQQDPETGSALVRIEFDAFNMLPLWIGAKGYVRTETGKRVIINGGLRLAASARSLRREDLIA